jgi:predicted nucleotidyltransferase
MHSNQFGLTKTTIERIQNVFLHYPEIEKVLLYGSRAMGNYREGSDIDLTLLGNHLTYRQLSQIETELEELMLPYSIDLSLFVHIDNKDLIQHILHNGKIFYKKR